MNISVKTKIFWGVIPWYRYYCLMKIKKTDIKNHMLLCPFNVLVLYICREDANRSGESGKVRVECLHLQIYRIRSCQCPSFFLIFHRMCCEYCANLHSSQGDHHFIHPPPPPQGEFIKNFAFIKPSFIKSVIRQCKIRL